MKMKTIYSSQPIAAPLKPFASITRPTAFPAAALDWFKSHNINPPAENRLEVRNDGDVAEINLLGSVGKDWDGNGITEQELRNAFSSIPKGKQILLNVNSTGGFVGEGIGLHTAIKDRAECVTARITGYALSAASFFPLAAGRVVTAESAVWMIHPAQWYAVGSATEMRKAADVMDTHDEAILGIYMAKTGKSKAELKAAMEKETWMTGAEAVAFGLADELDENSEENKSAEAKPATPPPTATAAQAVVATVQPTQPLTASAPTLPAATPPQVIPQPPTPQNTMPENNTPAAVQPAAQTIAPTPVAAAPTVSREEFDKVVAQMKREKIENKVLEYVSKGVITNAEAPIFVTAALADEKGTLEILNAKEPVLNGSVVGSHFEVGATELMPTDVAVRNFAPVANILNTHKANPAAARKELIKNWDGIIAAATKADIKKGLMPMNANSISGFTTAFLLSGSLTPLQNKWAPLMAISRDYSTDPYKPLATATLKNATAASATLTDATTFNTGNSTVGALTATMHQYTQPFQISNTDLNSGLRMEDLITINQAAFADKVISVALAPVTVANFGAATVTSSAAAFGFNELATLQGALQKANKKNLILDGAYQARVSNTPGFFQQAGLVNGNPNAWSAFGWDGVYLNSNWTGAGANIKGIALDPQALFGIIGMPLTPVGVNGGIFNQNTMQVDGIGITVAVYTWFDVNTRTFWCSYDIVAGFGLGDATAGFLLASQ